MLRVLIADDEQRICQLIRVLGQWEAFGLEVVGVVSNGLEAIEMIRTLKPDILITDIRMPGCDGLDVIREGLEHAPWMEVIIISGYAQFNYAQTALQYGVGEYLLKPINRDALNHALEKMAARCHARKQQETDLQLMISSHKDDRMLLRAKLISDLISGSVSSQDAEALQTQYRFSACEEAFRVFVLKTDYDTTAFGKASLDIVCDKALSCFETALQGAFGDVVMGCVESSIVGVINYAEKDIALVRAKLRDALNQLVAQRNLLGQVDFSLALGAVCFDAKALSDSYRSARAVAAQRLIEGTGRLLEDSPASPMQPNLTLQREYDHAITQAIDVMSLSQADEAVDALRKAADAQGLSGQKYLDLVRGAALLFTTRLGIEDVGEMLASFESQCGHCGTLDGLFACLKALQQRELETIMKRRRERDTQPVRDAKEYIRKHFSEPISLETVSEAIGLSVNYFSTVFKRETGEGFVKYLTRIRMEEARTLLKETRLSLVDICNQVGYNDLRHFKRIFKQETGLSPNEYRKVYG